MSGPADLVAASREFLTMVRRGEESEPFVTKFADAAASELPVGREVPDAATVLWVNLYNAFVQLHLKADPSLYLLRYRREGVRAGGYLALAAGCVRMVSNTRLYGASIAAVSGVYSLWSASMAERMVASALLMAVLGVVVIGHGVVLLTPYAEKLGSASGPIMIVYSLLMLLNQMLLAAGVLNDGSSMMGMGGMGGSRMTAGMGWDAGMAALALLMLLSGVIMTRKTSMNGSKGM